MASIYFHFIPIPLPLSLLGSSIALRLLDRIGSQKKKKKGKCWPENATFNVENLQASAMSSNTKSGKKGGRSAIADVVSREYTIHLRKKVCSNQICSIDQIGHRSPSQALCYPVLFPFSRKPDRDYTPSIMDSGPRTWFQDRLLSGYCVKMSSVGMASGFRRSSQSNIFALPWKTFDKKEETRIASLCHSACLMSFLWKKHHQGSE